MPQLASIKHASVTNHRCQSIVEIAAGNPDFSTLVAAVTAADLVETLSGTGPFTVFAPTDEAFAKIPKADLDALLANKEKLSAAATPRTLNVAFDTQREKSHLLQFAFYSLQQ